MGLLDGIIGEPIGQEAAGCAIQEEPQSSRWDKFDAIERMIVSQLPQAEVKTEHRFTPGLYIRTTFVAAGTLFTSYIHKTEHPFVLSSGIARVFIDGVGWEEIHAPYMGITKPGTRRLVIGITDTVCTTFHPTDLTDVDAIEAEIYEDHFDHLRGLSHPVLPSVTPAQLAVAAGTIAGV